MKLIITKPHFSSRMIGDRREIVCIMTCPYCAGKQGGSGWTWKEAMSYAAMGILSHQSVSLNCLHIQEQHGGLRKSWQEYTTASSLGQGPTEAETSTPATSPQRRRSSPTILERIAMAAGWLPRR